MRRLGEDFGEAKLTKLRERLTARRHTSPTRSMRSQGLAVLTRGFCGLRGALGPTACGAGTLNGRLRNMRFGVQQQFIPLQTIRDARARAHSYGMSRIFGPQIVFS